MAVLRRKKLIPIAVPSSEEEKSMAPHQLIALAEEHGVSTEPLDISKLIELLGIKIVREPMSDERSGYVQKRRSGWVIGVNSLHHPRRQRFTLAHELAHYMLHRNDQDEFFDTTFFRSNESNPMEREANQFAAELLMPEELFRDSISSGIRRVSDLASRFQTSAKAVQIRAKELGYRMSSAS